MRTRWREGEWRGGVVAESLVINYKPTVARRWAAAGRPQNRHAPAGGGSPGKAGPARGKPWGFVWLARGGSKSKKKVKGGRKKAGGSEKVRWGKGAGLTTQKKTRGDKKKEKKSRVAPNRPPPKTRGAPQGGWRGRSGNALARTAGSERSSIRRAFPPRE